MWQKLDNTLGLLARGMDGAALRQQVLSNNIANIDTPNFKGQDVSFYTQLKGIMNGPIPMNSLHLDRTVENHLPGLAPTVTPTPFRVTQTTGQVRADGNNINIDVENAKIAENNIYYSTLATVAARKYKMMERAITKGGE